MTDHILSVDVLVELLVRQIEDLPIAVETVGEVLDGFVADEATMQQVRQGLQPILDQARNLQARLQER